ncbi:MAG TPA: biopolymer transporter ExbD, partial [Aggregatilineales bacterium]|nr:biopolymer transporter ExbD [Aggregatilineales bacterium]
MMNFRRGRPREEPEINLIPMIDVLLVILIFMMVTTSYAKFSELQINLPQAGGETGMEQSQPINVAVDASEHYAINNQGLSYSGVDALAASLKKA